MSHIVEGLLYTKEDEWIKVEGQTATVGVTDHAQNALSDIVFLDLPTTGKKFKTGKKFGEVESVKAAADLYMPVAGTILATNQTLLGKPELINTKPYDCWMIKIEIEDSAELSSLMDAQAYTDYCANR